MLQKHECGATVPLLTLETVRPIGYLSTPASRVCSRRRRAKFKITMRNGTGSAIVKRIHLVIPELLAADLQILALAITNGAADPGWGGVPLSRRRFKRKSSSPLPLDARGQEYSSVRAAGSGPKGGRQSCGSVS
ncbi:hypothetical protein [Actinoplanes sp. NPDC049802]|uniref:hypothetical protein n=1 Tax=Actinoplanes sp. NPDC049802 TaxID=3154742 RepID=UPI0033F2F87D